METFHNWHLLITVVIILAIDRANLCWIPTFWKYNTFCQRDQSTLLRSALHLPARLFDSVALCVSMDYGKLDGFEAEIRKWPCSIHVENTLCWGILVELPNQLSEPGIKSGLVQLDGPWECHLFALLVYPLLFIVAVTLWRGRSISMDTIACEHHGIIN